MELPKYLLEEAIYKLFLMLWSWPNIYSKKSKQDHSKIKDFYNLENPQVNL